MDNIVYILPTVCINPAEQSLALSSNKNYGLSNRVSKERAQRQSHVWVSRPENSPNPWTKNQANRYSRPIFWLKRLSPPWPYLSYICLSDKCEFHISRAWVSFDAAKVYPLCFLRKLIFHTSSIIHALLFPWSCTPSFGRIQVNTHSVPSALLEISTTVLRGKISWNIQFPCERNFDLILLKQLSFRVNHLMELTLTWWSPMGTWKSLKREKSTRMGQRKTAAVYDEVKEGAGALRIKALQK